MKKKLRREKIIKNLNIKDNDQETEETEVNEEDEVNKNET